MKSPDRDAADEDVAGKLTDKLEYCIASYGVPIELADAIRAAIQSFEAQASELATLRRRVAEMEETLRYYANGPFAGRARIALSPPTRKE